MLEILLEIVAMTAWLLVVLGRQKYYSQHDDINIIIRLKYVNTPVFSPTMPVHDGRDRSHSK